MSIEPFLLDADERAGKENKKAFVHYTPIGTGSWADKMQEG